MRTPEQIEEQIDSALEAMEEQPDNESYYRGVRVALGWVIEEDDDPPVG